MNSTQKKNTRKPYSKNQSITTKKCDATDEPQAKKYHSLIDKFPIVRTKAHSSSIHNSTIKSNDKGITLDPFKTLLYGIEKVSFQNYMLHSAPAGHMKIGVLQFMKFEDGFPAVGDIQLNQHVLSLCESCRVFKLPLKATYMKYIDAYFDYYIPCLTVIPFAYQGNSVSYSSAIDSLSFSLPHDLNGAQLPSNLNLTRSHHECPNDYNHNNNSCSFNIPAMHPPADNNDHQHTGYLFPVNAFCPPVIHIHPYSSPLHNDPPPSLHHQHQHQHQHHQH